MTKEELEEKFERLKEQHKKRCRKYYKTEKGKLAKARANKRYRDKKKGLKNE